MFCFALYIESCLLDYFQAGSQDTLNSIALKFNITPNKLVELNKLFTHTIVPGQVMIFLLHITLEMLHLSFIATFNASLLVSQNYHQW